MSLWEAGASPSRLVWYRGMFVPEDEALSSLRAWIDDGGATARAPEETLKALDLLRELLDHPRVNMTTVRRMLDQFRANGFERRMLADIIGAFIDGRD